MTKPLLCLFTLSFAIVSCNHTPDKSQSTTTDTLKIQTIVQSQNIDTALHHQSSPAIVSLPFGPAHGAESICEDDNFYFNLIGEEYSIQNGFKRFTPTYQLPPIEKYRYTVIDTLFDAGSCHFNIPIDSVIKITKFK